jgi:ATP-binding cassette subfamily C protein LapB
MGYDTPVGEGGRALSGGQRQCIALARSLLFESELIVLDEPSNSMDGTTEQTVRQRLQEYLQDRTLILITHRASMLEMVDRVIVIEDGRILLDGNKDKVLEQLKGRGGNAY